MLWDGCVIPIHCYVILLLVYLSCRSYDMILWDITPLSLSVPHYTTPTLSMISFCHPSPTHPTMSPALSVPVILIANTSSQRTPSPVPQYSLLLNAFIRCHFIYFAVIFFQDSRLWEMRLAWMTLTRTPSLSVMLLVYPPQSTRWEKRGGMREREGDGWGKEDRKEKNRVEKKKGRKESRKEKRKETRK